MSDPQSLSPSDPTALGEYTLVGRLGKGGQGVVYLGRDAGGEEFAIKVLNDQWSEDAELRKRFEKEVRAAQKVASFCTAAIHEANLEADPPYVVSEYVSGPDLQESVARKGPHRGSALQRLAVSTATALVAIHQAGIVHRDFKPGNVLLGQDGPRVIDFGIARVVDGSATLTNSIMGTPSYMAPEQIEGGAVTDKVDIFAWGCVIAFASTGNAPFGADSVPAVVHRVVSAPPSLDGVPDQLRPIVEACLNKDPDQRPTARELLMRLLGHEETSAPSTDEVMAEGQRLAHTQTPSGPQTPPGPPPPPAGPVTPSGPQTPYPGQPGQYGRPGAPPLSPTATGYPTPPPGGQGVTGPRPGPAVTGGNPGMSRPLGMGGPGPYTGPGMPARPPQGGVPPHQQRRPPRPQQAEDPVLSQGWVVPAVLIAIIILLLLIVLIFVAG